MDSLWNVYLQNGHLNLDDLALLLSNEHSRIAMLHQNARLPVNMDILWNIYLQNRHLDVNDLALLLSNEHSRG